MVANMGKTLNEWDEKDYILFGCLSVALFLNIWGCMQIKEFTSSEYSPSPDVIGKSYFEGLANCFWFNCMLVQVQPSPPYSALVQFWLEYLTVTQVVAGSSPVRTAKGIITQLVRAKTINYEYKTYRKYW